VSYLFANRKTPHAGGPVMPGLSVTLLGKFTVKRGNHTLVGIQARKVQELFCYLALFHDHPQPRETLCELLWRDQPSACSRKYLRQTLWKLQSALNPLGDTLKPDLLVETDWLQLNPSGNHKLDVVEFDHTCNLIRDRRARDLTDEDFKVAQKALSLYNGDLLEGWYQDWCIFERERYQTMYITLLDKIVQYCEIHQDIEAGLAYCAEILRHDRANERAHRQMMRLYFMSGDRTRALRQYERCVSALHEELSVAPSERTTHLYGLIRQDAYKPNLALQITESELNELNESNTPLSDVLVRLEQFSETLNHIQFQVQKEIIAIEQTLSMGR
jgi:DNA-binding SARP family transcriptional activator